MNRMMYSLIALLASMVLSFGPREARAAAPPNDDIRNATEIRDFPSHRRLDTRDATTAPGDPECWGFVGHSVWFRVTAPTSASLPLTVHTIGSDFDTVVSIYTMTEGRLTEIRCDDNAVHPTSVAMFTAEAGQTYYIMVGSSGRAPGGDLQLGVERARAASNDALRDATVIEGLPFVDAVEMSRTTISLDEPPLCEVYGTIWYSFTPTESDQIFVAAFADAEFEPTIGLYERTPSGWELVSQSCGSQWKGGVDAGRTYVLGVGTRRGPNRAVTLVVQ
ncbi:hypothetical protein [Polyangium sp. 15x6]|uniref:hypothetical protein n=1 Tax=Polyangium sp. 15x6 TaxID=3042687 RepID=UPI00249CC5BA|nr:hypothetical protein [Polyangium sp. 15x6]MDI3289191.1 hypothetical protein [Polyangium sp. 15x6]